MVKNIHYIWQLSSKHNLICDCIVPNDYCYNQVIKWKMWNVDWHASFVCILNVSTILWNFCLHQDTNSKWYNNFHKCKISRVKEHPNMRNALLLVLKMWRAHLICTHANPNIHLCVRKVCVKCLQLGSFAIHVTRLPHLSSPLRVCKHPYSIQHDEYRNMLFCHIVWLSWTVTTLSTPNTKRLHTKHVST